MKYPDLSSKRARLAIRFFTYGVMTIATVALSAVLLLLALGYRFDKNKLTFSQGSLIQLRSRPEGAGIMIDNKKLGFNTPGKIIVTAGSHRVSMTLGGYRPWSKTVVTQPGQLLWLNYIRFVPENLTTTIIKQFPALESARFSPDRRWLVLQPSSAQPSLILADLRNEQKPVFVDWAFGLPALPAGASQKIEIIEWDLGARYLLIRRSVGQNQTYFRLDREKPAEALTVLPALSGQPAVIAAHFGGTNGDVLYVLLAGGELRRLSLPSGASDLLAAGVSQFDTYRGDMLWYLADQQNARQVGVVKNGRDTVAATFPAGTLLSVALSSYFGHDYLAVAQANQVSLIRDPFETSGVASSDYANFKIEQPGVEWLYFSTNGRMLVAQWQANVTVYDLETNQVFRRDFSSGSQQQAARKLNWLDDYYFWLDLNGGLRIAEFDGSNERFISSVKPGFDASLSENGQVLFSIGQNTLTKAFELQSSNMVAR